MSGNRQVCGAGPCADDSAPYRTKALSCRLRGFSFSALQDFGRELTRRLTDAGNRVRVLVRNPGKIALDLRIPDSSLSPVI